ncbi:MAG: IS21 family transposase [Steroidobacteraceae bacterium]
MRHERAKGANQELAGARSGMSVRTVRNYEKRGRLPSECKQPRNWRTRADPFAEDWGWIVTELEHDAALQAKTLFEVLTDRHPGCYQSGQLRTLQRRIAQWRCQHGPEREVMFEQRWQPAQYAQSDFTHAEALGVTIAGEPFAHLLFHLVLPYSNWEAVKVCFSESLEALAEGMETCLQAIGGVPRIHRTDNLSAAIKDLHRDGSERDFTESYRAVLAHFGMSSSTNHPGASHQNGDVESAHGQFKRALDQSLRLRGHRDFRDRGAYETYLQELVRRRNATRTARFEEERQLLLPLPATPLEPPRELQVRVNRFSLIRVLANTYSVPSRLIGARLKVRCRAETLELYHGAAHLLSLPRLRGRQRQRIDYRHLIWSLIKKPGAFMRYKYREEMFPSLVFRQAFDALDRCMPSVAIGEYLRLLHLAASTSEAEVAEAIGRLLDDRQAPTFASVRALLPSRPKHPAELTVPARIDLAAYDALMTGQGHG